MTDQQAGQNTSPEDFSRPLPALRGEQRCQRLIEAATDYTYTVRVENGSPSRTVHSPSSSAITGYTPGEYERNPYLWFEMIHQDDRELVRDRVERIMAGSEVLPFEHRIIHKNGEIRWVRNTVVPFYDEGGRLVEYDALVSDITGARIAAAQIARANRAYQTLSLCNQALVRSATEQGLLKKICHILVEHGGYARAWVGYAGQDEEKPVRIAAREGKEPEFSRDPKSGRTTATEECGRSAAEAAIRTGRNVLHDRGSHQTEHSQWQEEAGQHGSLSVIALPLRAEMEVIGALTLYSGEGMASNPHEITLLSELAADLGFGIMALRTRKKHARARKSMIASEIRLQAIFDTVQTGIVIIDRENRRIVDANQTASQLIGLPRRKIIGAPCHKFICPTGKKQCQVLDPGQQMNNSERTVLRTADGELPILKSIVELELNGRACLVESFLDISKQVQDEKERLRLQGQLRQAQKLEAIGTLAGGIAHDFNNLLHAILGYAGLLEHTLPKTSEQHQFALAIKEAGINAAALIKQILAFSRHNEQERRPLQLQYMIKEALKLLRATLPTTIAMQPEIDMKCPPVLADSVEIHQIVMNLGTNAYHAMREQGGVLTVKLDEIEMDDQASKSCAVHDLAPGRYVRLTVSDTGHGMDEATRMRIFDPYFTTKENGEGTGLGLAIVHGIIKGYGGAIAVRSTLGEGATFTMFFPVSRQDAALPEKEKKEVVLAKTNGRALVVDDVELNVALGRYTLKRLGWEVTGFSDSRDALGLFSEAPEKFDLVITDQTMPHLTGLELAKKLLAIRPDIPIIMVTGHSERIDEQRAKDAGIRKFLTKPLDCATLSTAMNEIFPPPSS